MLRLYTFLSSPNALKVRLALAELGATYEPVEVNLLGEEQKSEVFGRVTPHHKVPVLEDGELVLRESNAILWYLGRSLGETRWPEVITSEAIALQWLFFESAHLATPCKKIWWNDRIAPGLARPPVPEALMSDAVTELERSLGVLDAALAGHNYLLGDSLTLVDCSIGATVALLRSTRLDDPARWPHVAAYVDRIRARPTWAEAQGEAVAGAGGTAG